MELGGLCVWVRNGDIIPPVEICEVVTTVALVLVADILSSSECTQTEVVESAMWVVEGKDSSVYLDITDFCT